MFKIFYILLPLLFTSTSCQTAKEEVVPIEPVKFVYKSNPIIFTRVVKRLITNDISVIRYESPKKVISSYPVICDITIRYIRGNNNKYTISVNNKPIGILPYSNPPHSIHSVKKMTYYTYRFKIEDALEYTFVIQRLSGYRQNDIFIDSIRLEKIP